MFLSRDPGTNSAVLILTKQWLHTFFSNSVKVLQQYLRARGVANQRKLDLVRLCEAAEEIGIELDPDGLLEDREEILKKKSTTHDNEMLKNPVLEVKSDDLSKLRQISIFDIYNYLFGFKMYDHSTLHNNQRMEKYLYLISTIIYLDLKCMTTALYVTISVWKAIQCLKMDMF